MSEVPPGISPTRQRFIDRSRMVAAVSGATVVVEAGARLGTMRTAQEAKGLGRIIGAVPGPVTSAASHGTNLLLQEGDARLITNANDVLRLLSPSGGFGRGEFLERNDVRRAPRNVESVLQM